MSLTVVQLDLWGSEEACNTHLALGEGNFKPRDTHTDRTQMVVSSQSSSISQGPGFGGWVLHPVLLLLLSVTTSHTYQQLQ
jgi:hypothetical protein